jgi:hypothetical protein
MTRYQSQMLVDAPERDWRVCYSDETLPVGSFRAQRYVTTERAASAELAEWQVRQRLGCGTVHYAYAL